VAQRTRQTVLAEFLRSLQECKSLAADAYLWSLPHAHGARPYIKRERRDSMTELAFLRAFLAWEVFLEKSFVLHLLGQKPPRGRAPYRYTFPPDQRTAMDWLVPEGRPYANWTGAAAVRTRAERYFRGGGHYAGVLSSNQNVLDETQTIRNAIAHESMSARQKFENLVRNKLRTLPHNLTVGGFLGTTIPGSSPPVSFLEFSINKIDFAARQIVPS
jgi:hypothetical protein